jgi:Domain of unknown function (DUF4389)
MTPENPPYPVRVDVEYPAKLSRLLIFVNWLLVIPHYVALLFLGIGVLVVWVISWFAVLFTGRYPQGMFEYVVGVVRWAARVVAYQLLVTDQYPPFSLADDPSYPVRVEVDYPAQIARWRPLVHWLLVIPAAIALYVILLIAYVASFLAWFAILFTGRIPQGLFNAIVIGMRWSIRVNVFQYWMTEAYPPFVWA